jgi:heavy metal sensor kinase
MSIRTRLTLWYTGLLAIFLLIFNTLVYVSLSGVLLGDIDSRLAGQAVEVANLIEHENNPDAVIATGRAVLPAIDIFSSQYFIQITDLAGRVAQVSPNLQGEYLPVPAGDLPLSEAVAFTVDAGSGVHVRVVSSPIVLADQFFGTVQVAQSLAGMDDALRALRRVLLFGSGILLVLAALGGGVLARAALRPIHAITETARQITQTGDLEQRIPVADPNDEIGQLTETFNDMLSRLEQLFQAQQRLVADVSHELRTPLTTIQGNLDLLRRGATDDLELRAAALRAIGDETGRMRRLVNDLLLLAQADAGLTLYKQPVEMDTLLLEIYRQALVMARGEVTVRLGAEDQALVMGDADRLRQLLLNLVDNALKYTPSDGDVTLTLSRSDGWVKVAVADTGIGMTPEDQARIFDRFYRSDPSRTRPGGSGLGLAIAQWVVQAHDGRIEVESTLGQGSKFTVWLPDASGHAPVSEETHERAEAL